MVLFLLPEISGLSYYTNLLLLISTQASCAKSKGQQISMGLRCAECIQYLRSNKHNIRSLCIIKLPLELKGSHSNVAGSTIASLLEILYKGLIWLHEKVTTLTCTSVNKTSLSFTNKNTSTWKNW